MHYLICVSVHLALFSSNRIPNSFVNVFVLNIFVISDAGDNAGSVVREFLALQYAFLFLGCHVVREWSCLLLVEDLLDKNQIVSFRHFYYRGEEVANFAVKSFIEFFWDPDYICVEVVRDLSASVFVIIIRFSKRAVSRFGITSVNNIAIN